MYQNIHYDNYKRKIHIWDDTKGYLTFPYKKYAYIKNQYGTHVSLYGDKLKKVFKVSKEDHNLFESDVTPEMRTLVDMYMDSDEPSVGHTTMYFDIEVEVTEGFPNPKKADNVITSIALYDSIMNEYYCFVLDTKDRIQNFKERNETVEVFKTEYELLNRFFAKYLEIRPTILTGWSIDHFDVPYLYNRACKILGKDVARCLSPIGEVRWNTYRKRYVIAGVSCLDYLALYKKYTFVDQSSYRLDSIGQYELGDKKIEYEGTLNDLYENDINKFVEYNIHDVRLVKKLNDKLDFIEIARAVCHIGHVPYEDIYFSSRYLEGAVLTHLKKLNIVAPNKDPKGRDHMNGDVTFVGAYVQDPQKGKHDWVYDLDITSMYPSIIMSLNISPETKIGKVIGWDAGEFIKGKNKTYSIKMNGKKKGQLTEIELKEFFDNNQVSISSNGVLYKTDKPGLIPAILSKWFDQRKEYRKLMKKFSDEGDQDKSEYFYRRQYIQKIILNSFYGVLGLPVFRFYDLDNASSVTETGQTLIKFTKKLVNHFYNKELGTEKDYCIYIDTDSVFYSAVPLVEHRFKGKEMSDVMMAQRILEIASEVQTFLNTSYDYFAKRFCNLNKHGFDIKQEVIAKSGLFIVKKRYAMRIINEDGIKVDKILVKGLDTVRSNFAESFRELMKNVLEDILADVPRNKVDERIIKFKKSMSLINFDKIANPTGVKGIWKYLKKDGENTSVFSRVHKGAPVHVKSAIAYNDLLKYYKRENKYAYIQNGEKIKWVYLKQNSFGLNVVAFKGYEDPPEILQFIRDNIDPNKMYDQSLKKKLQMFYDSLNWGEPVDKEQSMERFF